MYQPKLVWCEYSGITRVLLNTHRFLEAGLQDPITSVMDIKPVREYFDCYVTLAQHALPSIGRPPPSTLGSTAPLTPGSTVW